jgi:uncharacterized protein YlzI (FlbEa/FlbD family)
MAAMAKMVTLHRCGKEIVINADQIKWIERHPSTKGTLIHFMSGHPLDVDEAPDAVRSTVNGPLLNTSSFVSFVVTRAEICLQQESFQPVALEDSRFLRHSTTNFARTQ